MKDFRDIIDYIVKNKYVIICVMIVVLLYVLGIIEFLTKFVVLLFLVTLAVFIGKKLQDNDKYIHKIFNFKGYRKDSENVYYYQETNKKK